MDEHSGTEQIALPAPGQAEQTVGFPSESNSEGSERVTSDADPFPDGERPSDAASVARPSVRGGVGRYIALFICSALGAFAVFAVAAGIGDALGKAGVTLPAFLYGEVVNSGLSEIPKNGDGVILTGRVRVPYAPSLTEDGTGGLPGALEADGEEADGGAEIPEEGVELPIRSVDLSETDPYGVINETDYLPDYGAISNRKSAIPAAAELYGEYGEG